MPKAIERAIKRFWSAMRPPLVRVSYWQMGADAARAGRPARPPFPAQTFTTEYELDLAESSWLNGWDWASAQVLTKPRSDKTGS